MGKKEERQLLEVVGTGAGSGDRDKLLRLLYPKQKPGQAAATLEREDVKHLRLTVNVANTIDVNAIRAECGSSPLILSCLNGHYDLALLLLQHDADVNRQDLNGNTALHWAAFHDRQHFVELLIKAKVKPNIANKDGDTPLHFIVQKLQPGKSLTLVKLLQCGATGRAKNNAGDTPLTLAARLNKIDAVSLLVDSCRELADETKPLIEACRTGRVELSEVLLECGFNPNGLDVSSGARPIHEAVQFCRPKICKLLIEFGADSMMKDAKGNTAESLARMLPGNRGPEYLHIFEQGREVEARKPRVEKLAELKRQEQKAKEVTENLPLMKMFTHWTRNVRPYRTRTDPYNTAFNLFDGNRDTRYIIPRGRHNYVSFDFGSQFIINGVQVQGSDRPETIRNFEILYATSMEGPWRIARAFRAKPSNKPQTFQDFVAVSRYLRFVAVDNYTDDLESETTFANLAFYGIDAEFKTLFGDMGLAKYDADFIQAGHSTIASLLNLDKSDIGRIVQNPDHVDTIVQTLKSLKKTYVYSSNQNIWWKTPPVAKCAAGRAIPAFSCYVDSGVNQEFFLSLKGDGVLTGETRVRSVPDPKNYNRPSVVTFSNISISPAGVYLIEISDSRTRKCKLSAYHALEVGDSAMAPDTVKSFYAGLTEKLSFTQA